MRILTLDIRISAAALRQELRFTLVRLKRRLWAKAWVPIFEGLLKETEAGVTDWQKLLDAQEDAEAELDDADRELDAVVMHTAALISTELNGGARATMHQALFGSERPSSLVRPKLGEELAQVRQWPAVLAVAPLAKLVSHKATVEAVVKRCDEAETGQSQADGAVEAYRVKTWAPLVAKVNGERQKLGGEAAKQTHTDLTQGSGEGLFRQSKRSRGKLPATLAAVRGELADAEAEVKRLREQEATLFAEEQQAAQAALDREQKAKVLAELERTQAETDAKVQALRQELHKPRKH